MSKRRLKGQERPVKGGQYYPLFHSPGGGRCRVVGVFRERQDVRVCDADGNLKEVVTGEEARKSTCARRVIKEEEYKKMYSMVKVTEGTKSFFRKGAIQKDVARLGSNDALKNFEKASSKDFLNKKGLIDEVGEITQQMWDAPLMNWVVYRAGDPNCDHRSIIVTGDREECTRCGRVRLRA